MKNRKKKKATTRRLKSIEDNLTEGELKAANTLVEDYRADKEHARRSMTRLIRYALSIEDKLMAADIIQLLCYAWNNFDFNAKQTNENENER